MKKKYNIQTVETLDYNNEIIGIKFYYNTASNGVIKSHGASYIDARKQFKEQLGDIMGFDREEFKPYEENSINNKVYIIKKNRDTLLDMMESG